MVSVYLAPIYILINVYILWRFLKWLKLCHENLGKKSVRIILIVLYSLFVISIPAGFLMSSGHIGRIIKLLSNYWIGIQLFTVLVIVIAEIIRLILWHCKLFDQKKVRSIKFAKVAGVLCMIAIISLSFYSSINARIIYNTEYNIKVEKKSKNINKLKAMLIADLHMGYNIGCSHISDMVDKINEQDPDIVFIAGDIFDNSIEALDDYDKLSGLLRNM